MWTLLIFATALFAELKGNPISGNCDGCLPDTVGVDSEKVELDRIRRQTDEIPSVGPFGDIMNAINSNYNLNTRANKEETCRACKSAVTLVKFLSKNNKTEEEIMKVAGGVCSDLHILSQPVCEGLLRINGPSLLHIIKSTNMSSLEICSFLVNFDCSPEKTVEHLWSIDVPLRHDDIKFIKPIVVRNGLIKPLKVLHISDTHYDPHYVEGAPDNCSLPLCCRATSGEVTANTSVSGKWGGWKCDIPERTLDNLLEHINKEHSDLDYVIWTGDIPPHDSWSLSKEEGLMIINNTISKIKKAFPNIPIYPALGNHESVPPNLFPSSKVEERWSVDWLYEELEKEWSQWVPSTETIRKGGFYTVLIKPGFRLVSLNTNFCYFGNWWLILNSTDPMQELKWLVDVLLKAEENGEKVHIIGHIPPGHKECLKTWQTNYYAVIERFYDTITGQFFGHTHSDEFELFYDVSNLKKARGVAYVAPSVTTYTFVNPGYRIYYVDGDFEGSRRRVLDHETWYMDLEESNKKGDPVWAELYSARDAYNLNSLEPDAWDDLYKRLMEDDELFERYDRYYWSNSPHRRKCDDECKKERFCEIRSCVQYGDYIKDSSEIML